MYDPSEKSPTSTSNKASARLRHCKQEHRHFGFETNAQRLRGRGSRRKKQAAHFRHRDAHPLRTDERRKEPVAQLEEEVGNRTRNFNAECPPHTGPPPVSSFRVQRSSVHTTPALCRIFPFRLQPIAAVTHGGRNHKDFAEDESFEAQLWLRGHPSLASSSREHGEGGPTWSTAEKATGWASVTYLFGPQRLRDSRTRTYAPLWES